MKVSEAKALQALMRLERALAELCEAAILIEVCHKQKINQYQAEMVQCCIDFGYADSKPLKPKLCGDSTYWKFSKFKLAEKGFEL